MINIVSRSLFCAFILFPSVILAQAAPLSPGDVVATRAGVDLTVALVDQKVASMPEEIRGGYFDEPGRMARLIDSVLLTAQLAEKAESSGLTVIVPTGATELDRMTALANAVLESKGILHSDEDYLVLAKERYQARKKDYASLESYDLQYIFIDASSRGSVAARLIADAVKMRADAGENFSDLIKEYSDVEGDHPLNGTIDYSLAMKLGGALQSALSAVGRNPGVSPVVEDQAGSHILRLVEYHPPVVPPFEDIKSQIVAQLKEESVVGTKTAFMRELSLQDVTLNDAVVQRLVSRYHRAGDETGVKIITP